jgi:SAM-dependent methyltransferase
MMVALALEHGARGPVLEIGCASGGTLAALQQAGFDGFGVDVSDLAVSRATERLGPGRVWQCDPERDGFPAALREKAPFGAIVMASVLEHFHDPFAVVAGLRDIVAPSAVLIIVTTNADSLGHRVFGNDWEGYVDWSHHGVDQVTPSSLRARLPEGGWSIETLRTWHLWDGSADPIHASMREWFSSDARMRQLLEERELGDFITCVARRL